MPEPSDVHRFAVTRLGAFAEAALDRVGVGRVAAVFEHSFYVEMAAGLVCIGAAGLSPGPLNAVCTAPARTSWWAIGLRTGDRVIVGGSALRVGARLSFILEGAERWRPAPLPPCRARAPVRTGLAQLTAHALPRDGLGRLMLPSLDWRPQSHVLRRARAPAAELRRWLAAVMRAQHGDALHEVHGLLGLGPGLTPSGDDLLGGVMITLHTLGMRRALNQLSTIVHRWARTRTTPISTAHLTAAMKGLGGASIHDALAALFSGRAVNLARALADIEHSGHCSGWDTLAGVAITLHAWVKASPPNREAA